MATKVIGKLDGWEDADLGGNDFMTLEEGANPIRVFSSPYQFYVIWTEDASGKKRKIRTPLENCPLVARGEKPQARWYIGVLDRDNDNKPSILEIGPQIFRQIMALSKKEKWGDPKGYDIDIVRQPKGSQPLYVVSPEPHTSLEKEEKVAITEFMDRIDLVKMTEAPTPDEVREQVGLPAEPSTSTVDNDFGSTDTGTGTDSDGDDVNFDTDF